MEVQMKKNILISLLVTCSLSASIKITDVSQLDSVHVTSIFTAESVTQLQNKLSTLKGPISIAGACCSQGLHIAIRNGTMIDLKHLNHVVGFDKKKKQITVEAGITWRDIQIYIDRHNLSLAAIQSYNDFSVGGSLSVNAHGRDIHHGSLITAVDSVDILLASGTVVHANRTENADIFFGAIGGYGALGIIIRATFNLVENCVLERNVECVSLSHYSDHFFKQIKNDLHVQLHNANIFPPDFDMVASITWRETEQPLTIKDRLQKYGTFYPGHMFGELCVRRSQIAQNIREQKEWADFKQPRVVWRNYEMSHTINTLEPLTRSISSSILQEYFIPVKQYYTFAKQLKAIIKTYDINMLNISIRYVLADEGTVLAYAPQESFAFVCYINIFNADSSKKNAAIWTQKLIDAALSCNGTYYLPYQPWATVAQFKRTYPGYKTLLAYKKRYDPTFAFKNMFLDRYIFG